MKTTKSVSKKQERIQVIPSNGETLTISEKEVEKHLNKFFKEHTKAQTINYFDTHIICTGVKNVRGKHFETL